MVWFKVDDSFYDHPKVFDAPDCAVALWTRAGTWSARNLTDGFVPTGMPARLCDDPDTAVRELVRRGLWKRTSGGYQFHDWTTYQPAAADVREIRAKRSAAGRKGGQVKAANAKQNAGNALASASNVAKQNATPTRPEGSVVTVDLLRGQTVTRTREDPPSNRCPDHIDDPDPPPCGGCAGARKNRQAWDRARADQAGATQSARARADAEARRAAIDSCLHCDAHGYVGPVLCAHDPTAAARTRAGVAAARAATGRPANAVLDEQTT